LVRVLGQCPLLDIPDRQEKPCRSGICVSAIKWADRCRRGRGTSAASRCMNSSDDMTRWLVPSR